jgi:hypothetical protein
MPPPVYRLLLENNATMTMRMMTATKSEGKTLLNTDTSPADPPFKFSFEIPEGNTPTGKDT